MSEIKKDLDSEWMEENSSGMTADAEGLLADIELYANKFLMLLQNSSMPDEIKESFVEMLPIFSLAQIEKLTGILEAKYLDEKTRQLDQQLKNELNEVIERFKLDDEKDSETFLNQINVISQKYEMEI